jgi:hypothetical protein
MPLRMHLNLWGLGSNVRFALPAGCRLPVAGCWLLVVRLVMDPLLSLSPNGKRLPLAAACLSYPLFSG